MTETESLIFDLGLRELTLQRLQAYSENNNTTLIEAIDLIVSEWAGGGKFGRLKATEESPNLSEIQERFERIENKVDQVAVDLEEHDSTFR